MLGRLRRHARDLPALRDPQHVPITMNAITIIIVIIIIIIIVTVVIILMISIIVITVLVLFSLQPRDTSAASPGSGSCSRFPDSCRRAILRYPVFVCVFFHLGNS